MTVQNRKNTLTDGDLSLIATRIRRCVIEMCKAAGQGYAGQGLELADIMAVVFHDEMRRDANGQYIDRFILSTGHSAIALYAALWSVCAYELETLRSYGLDGTEIEESPLDDIAGFEVTGGSLGQGPSQAVGIALGEKMAGRSAKVLCEVSDGELQEGAVWEAFMFAGAHRLSNLTFLVDNNGEQADGRSVDVLDIGPLAPKFEAFGLTAIEVNGHDIPDLRRAFATRREMSGPVAIICKTIPGYGVVAFDRFSRVHYVRTEPEIWEEASRELDGRIAQFEKGGRP
jgi:transketolase